MKNAPLCVVVLLAVGLLSAACGSHPAATLKAPRSGSHPRPVTGTFEDLAKVVSAINRDRTADDALTGKAAHTAGGLVPADGQTRSMRVATSPVCGPLYVLPAAHAFVLVSGGGKLGAFGESVPGALGEHDPAAGAILASSDDAQGVCGIAIDDVVAVDVVAGNGTYPATLAANGYYWLAPRSLATHALSLRVHLKDGSIVNG